MQIINLDISKRAEVPAVHAKQHDVGRTFQAVITDGDAPYAIPKGAVFSVWYSGTGGTGNYSTVGGHSAFSVSGNTVTVEFSSAMLNCKGGGLMCLAMNDSKGTQLGFWDIPYFVEALPGADEPDAQQYYDAFAEVVAHAISASEQAQAAADKLKLDKTLSVSGRAAEAAAVGEALESKAPHGFGLGGAKKIAFADLDSTYAPGWYYLNDLPEGFVGGRTQAFLRVDAYGGSTNALQMLYTVGASHVTVQRFLWGSEGWGAWEQVRPKMDVGIEYRLPYLWCGLSIYAKLYKVTYAPAGSKVTINLDDDIGATVYPIFVSGRDKNRTVPNRNLGTNYINVRSGTGYVEIETASTYGGASAKPTICVFYTKEWEG